MRISVRLCVSTAYTLHVRMCVLLSFAQVRSVLLSIAQFGLGLLSFAQFCSASLSFAQVLLSFS